MRSKTNFLAGLPPLKRVEGRLPSVFDLHWDAKTAGDFVRYRLYENDEALRLLAEHGYDVKEFLTRCPKEQTELIEFLRPFTEVEIPDNFNIFTESGGNYDDAYEIGYQHGQAYIANYVLNVLSKYP